MTPTPARIELGQRILEAVSPPAETCKSSSCLFRLVPLFHPWHPTSKARDLGGTVCHSSCITCRCGLAVCTTHVALACCNGARSSAMASSCMAACPQLQTERFCNLQCVSAVLFGSSCVHAQVMSHGATKPSERLPLRRRKTQNRLLVLLVAVHLLGFSEACLARLACRTALRSLAHVAKMTTHVLHSRSETSGVNSSVRRDVE